LSYTPYIPSPHRVIKKALELACVKEGDILYDLGSGDGRVLIEAAKHGAYAVGVEMDPFLCELARVTIKEKKLEDKISIIEGDFFNTYLGQATVVYMYLYRMINEALSPKLEKELKIGTRIVTIDFPIPDWIPVSTGRLIDERDIIRTIFLYIVGISNPSSLIKRVNIIDYRGLLRRISCP